MSLNPGRVELGMHSLFYPKSYLNQKYTIDEKYFISTSMQHW